MWSIGFGFEKIGLAAKRHPVFFSLLIVLLSLVSAYQIRNLHFDGDVTAVLPETSPAYRDYFDNRQRFRDFSRDVTILVESDRLMTASGLEDLRFLQLELAVTEGVANATTIFSIPLPDPATGAAGQFFPQQIETDEAARDLVSRLLATYPQAGALIAPDRNVAVIQVSLEGDASANAMTSFPAYSRVREAAFAAAPADFRLKFTGLTAIGSTIVNGLISDQLRLSLIGLFIGAAIAYFVFRNVVAATIAALPTALTSLWTLGLFGMFGVPVNYLTTVLPTLALIIAFEDSIMLTFQWQKANAASFDPDANMEATLRETGPASALTSVTTLLAFVAFAYVSGTALQQFSWFGAAAIALAFLSVIITVPVAAYWAARLGLLRAGHVRTPALGGAGRMVLALVTGRPIAIATAALLAVCALTFVHFNIQPEYRITDYLPRTSEVRAAEMQANEVFGGRSALLVSVPKAESGPVLSPANRERLAETETVIAGLFPPERISSPLRLIHELKSEDAIGRLAADLDAASEAQRTGFQSRDGKAMLITIRIPSSQSINETLAEIRLLKESLAGLAFGDAVIVTGFDVLMAEEFTSLIEQLRGSLLIEVFLGILVIGIATRSPLLAIAAITPNLLPILFVEFVIWMRGGAVNMSEVIALTIGFGIAVGNAVHIINYFARRRREGLGVDDALAGAVIEAGPAVGASMLIICISMLVTQISVLPMVPVLGMLIISTLAVGFAANIAILPANILVLKRFFRENRAGEQAAKARSPEETV